MDKKHFVTAAALILASSSALAGATNDVPVEIDLEARSAIGNMASARFSADDTSLIGCGTREFSDGQGNSFSFGFCQAADANGNVQVCFTEQASLIDATTRLNDYSFITFSWNEAEECIRIGSSTQSVYIPTHVDKKPKSNNGLRVGQQN